MKANTKLISMIAMLLPLFAVMGVRAQGLNVETAVRSRFGIGTSVLTVPTKPKKDSVESTTSPATILAVTDKDAIVGSWLETITFNGPDPAPPLKALVTFLADGNMIVADQGAVSTGVVFSAGHGGWIHRRGRTFAWNSVEVMYDPTNGSLVGYLKVNGVYTVDPDGSEYTGNFSATISTPDGTVLFTVAGTNSGSRIELEAS